MTTPTRLQRRRTPGYNMQAESIAHNGLECVSVTRPGKWGNMFVVGGAFPKETNPWTFLSQHDFLIYIQRDREIPDALEAVRLFRRVVEHWQENDPEKFETYIAPLRGKNLACFCKLGEPCHADVLIEFANK